MSGYRYNPTERESRKKVSGTFQLMLVKVRVKITTLTDNNGISIRPLTSLTTRGTSAAEVYSSFTQSIYLIFDFQEFAGSHD